MKIILFGASGMVGQGVLRECLLDPIVESVLSVGRSKTGQTHTKLREIEKKDFFKFESIQDLLIGYDACFFTLGTSAFGKTEQEYSRITFDITIAAATILAKNNPQMVFTYVTGAGCDSTEQGKMMWARVKGKTENTLLKLPFKAAYMFRPGMIRPMHGIKSKTKLYQFFLDVFGPILPLLQRLFPKQITTTELLGVAMLNSVRHGYSKSILETNDIYTLAHQNQSTKQRKSL